MLVSDPLTRELLSSEDVSHALRRPARLAALERTRLLDSEPEDGFDRATRLATRLLSAPVSLVSLVTPERQFFKAQEGLQEPWASRRGTSITHSFCQYVVATRGPLVVNDACRDPLVHDNPAISELGVRAYLGVPLRETDGEVLGAFCAIDTSPRAWSRDDLKAMEDIAEGLGTEVALRLRAAALSKCEAELRDRHRETVRLSRELRHRAGNLLAVVTAIMNLSSRLNADVPAALAGLVDRVAALSRAHMACMDDDPHDADLATLLHSIAAGEPRVTVERGGRVTLPNAAVTSLGLIVHEWIKDLADPSARGRLSWRTVGPELHLSWRASGRTRPDSSLQGILVEASVQQLGGRMAKDGNAYTLTMPLPEG